MNALSVSTIPPPQIDAIYPLLRSSRVKPYRALLRQHGDHLDRFWFECIRQVLQSEQGRIFAVHGPEEPTAFAVYADLPWESRVYGQRMGALKYIAANPLLPDPRPTLSALVTHVCNWAVSAGIHFLLCKTYTDDVPLIHTLQEQGFLLVDTVVDFAYDAKRHPLRDIPAPALPSQATIRPASPDDREALTALAGAAFAGHFGRFHADERTSDEQATRIYQEWISSSLDGYADWILVAEIEDRIVGYSVWRKPSELEQMLPSVVGHYSIASTHPQFAGRGLFQGLTHAGMALFDGIADCIEGPTHINNFPVQRSYAKLNWRAVHARYSFHRWLI